MANIGDTTTINNRIYVYKGYGIWEEQPSAQNIVDSQEVILGELEQKTEPADTQKVDVVSSVLPTGAATEAKQDLLLAELEKKADLTETQPVSVTGISFPPGLATEAKQDVIVELIETLNELNARLSVFAGMANSGQPALRTIPIASVSTAVTGSVTATVASTVVSTLTNFGTGYPATEMSHDINNFTAIIANINNVVIT